MWKKLCESLLKGGVVLSKQDIQTLVSAVPFVPESVTETISQMTCEQTIKDDVLLLCKYVQMTQISFPTPEETPSPTPRRPISAPCAIWRSTSCRRFRKT